jgi:16S rRNA processing protein RimM
MPLTRVPGWKAEAQSVEGDRPKQFVAIARIVKPQGRRGEVAAEILTDFPSRFNKLRQVFLERPDRQPESAVVESACTHKGRIILKFAGIDSIDDANRLRSLHVLIRHEERRELPAHHYYVSDLVGCRVITEYEGHRELGTVTEVELTGGVDLLHVRRPSGRELLIPLAEAVCTRIDPEGKLIVVEPPEALLDLNP